MTQESEFYGKLCRHLLRKSLDEDQEKILKMQPQPVKYWDDYLERCKNGVLTTKM